MQSNPLTLKTLEEAVGSAAALRAITELEPAGGPGDKVFPPTYAVSDKEPTKYAIEQRHIGGELVDTVLLDSVASQANRMELALLAGYRSDELHFPLVEVSFRDCEGLEDLDTISSLEAPHRIADAILRDSLLDGELFRTSALGRSFVAATPRNAAAMYNICPHALLFGVWDSTGPLGGLGAKFQRVLVSEIIGYGAQRGVKTASRIDPLGVQRGVPIYESKSADSGWEIDPAHAKMKKGKPVLKGKDGKPSEANHGNIAPSIENKAGGVTLTSAKQVTVLSLTGLRQLSFPVTPEGEVLEGKTRADVEQAARTVIAAMGVAAIVYARRDGYHLRSRALFVPKSPLRIEIVSAEGEDLRVVDVDRATATALFKDAVQKAEAAGITWHSERVDLKPAEKLASLVRKSRALASAGEGDDADESK